jgi:hypothetical protein
MKHSIAFMALTVLLINAIPTASAQLPNQFQPQNPKPGDWIDYRPFPSWEPEKVLYLQDIPHSYAVQFLLKGDLQVKKGEKWQYLAGPVYLKFKGIFDPQNAAVEEIKPGFIMALKSAVVIITDVEEQGALEGKRVFLTVTSGNLLINKISDQYFPFYSRVLNQNGENIKVAALSVVSSLTYEAQGTITLKGEEEKISVKGGIQMVDDQIFAQQYGGQFIYSSTTAASIEIESATYGELRWYQDQR